MLRKSVVLVFIRLRVRARHHESVLSPGNHEIKTLSVSSVAKLISWEPLMIMMRAPPRDV